MEGAGRTGRRGGAGGRRGRHGRTAVAGALLAAAALHGPALAQDGSAPGPLSAQAPSTGAPSMGAPSSQTITYAIAPAPLDAALAAFGDRSNLQVLYPAELARGLRSPGVSGTLTREAALARLLAGTGLTFRFTDAATVTLARAAAPGDSFQLDPVTVEGRQAREDGFGPVPGPIAIRSGAATKIDRPIVETPQSISVVTAQQIAEQGSQTVMQAMRYTPGAFTGQVGASNRYDYVILRGFVDRSIDNIYLDGLKMMGDDSTYSSFQIDPYFLERIDAIKGPASVLYGRSSPGGLVALTSKKPQFDPSYEIEARAGTSNQRGLGFDLTGPIDPAGRLAYRLTGLADAADTQFDGAKEERYAIAPSLAVRLGEETRLTLQAYLQRDPEGGTHNGVPAEGSLFPRNGQRISRGFFDGEPGREKFRRDQNMVGYQFEHRFDEVWSVRQNLRYVDSKVRIDQIYQTGWAGDTNRLSRFYGGGDETLKAIAADTQLQADFATGEVGHTVLAGFDYQHRKARNDWVFGPAAEIDAFDPVYGNDGYTALSHMKAKRKLEQSGLYLQDQLAFGGWRLTLGVRQDWVETSIRDELAGSTSGEKRQRFTKRAGLLHLFDNGIAPYVSYAESFSPSLYMDANGNPLKPTEGKQYEAGIKYQPPGSRSLVSAAVFHIEQKNVAVQDPNTFVYSPVGTIRSRGVELEAQAHLTDNFRLQLGYTFTDATYKDRDDGKQGNTPPQVPRHMASLWADYSFTEGPLKHLSLGAGLRWVGRSWADSLNTRRVPDYTLLDASLRYELDALGLEGAQLRLNANNLLDKTYIASCLELTNCYFGERRSVTATLSYSF